MTPVWQPTEAKAGTAKTRIPIRPFAALAFDGIAITVQGGSPATPERTKARTILLVSHDAGGPAALPEAWLRLGRPYRWAAAPAPGGRGWRLNE